jgi:hypothetical protein
MPPVEVKVKAQGIGGAAMKAVRRSTAAHDQAVKPRGVLKSRSL